MNICLTILINCFFSWQSVVLPNRIFYSSDQITLPSTGKKIIKIKAYDASPYVIVKYEDKSRKSIDKDSLWGYSDKKGRLYRKYNDAFYLITSQDTIIKYVHMRLKSNGPPPHQLYDVYYSKNLNSLLYSNKKEALQ